MKIGNKYIVLMIVLMTIFNANAQEYTEGKLYIKILDESGIPNIENKNGQVLINMTNATIKSILENYGVYEFKPIIPNIQEMILTNYYGLDSTYVLHCTGNQENLMQSLISAQSGEYEYIEQDPVYYNHYEPNDYHLLDNIIGEADSALDLMNAKQAWNITQGNSSIKLGMYEIGAIDTTHIDLLNKVQVYDTVVDHYLSHGTFVAGCMAGETDNNMGKSSIGFDCSINYRQKYGDYETGWMSIIQSGIKVLNLSYGGPGDPNETHQQLVNLATEMGILVIASAGNGWFGNHPPSDYMYPASYANVLSVTSVDNSKNHYVWYQSTHPVHTHNDSVDVSAPGRRVIGLAPNNQYGIGSGTSFSAPYVAGIAGLIYSINPCLSPQQVTHIIKSTTENIDAQNPNYIGLIGTGLADAYAAVSYAQQNYLFTSHTIADSQNIYWDSLMYCSKVVIEDGGILHINSNAEIYMADTARIIVEPGGQLMIDGLISRSNCADFWEGIQVRGQANLSQTTQNQGAVRLLDNAVIEYARIGIMAQGMENGSVIPNSQGGIILADKGKLYNNKIGLLISDYIYTNAAGYPQLNASIIVDNIFEIDNEYYCYTDDDPIGVYISSITTIAVNGNEFDNNALSSNSNRGIGSYIFNANVLIKDTNTFVGWDYGVKALGSRNTAKITAKDNIFENNNTSIYLNAISFAEILFNDFDINANQSALYLDNCHDFTVEENDFHSLYSPNFPQSNSIGLVINNSDAYINEVYKNNFYRIKYAVLAQNKNRGTTDGLTFKCNTFTLNAFDISVTAENSGTNMGISPYQGSSDTAASAPAGNIFSYIGPTGTPTDLNNEENHFSYYYHDDNNDNLKPEYYTTNTISIVKNQDADWNENSCPSHYIGGGSGGGISGAKSQMASSGSTSDSLNAIYQALKDGGNTEAMQAEVDNSVPPETMEVYNELMAASPYLSDSVVQASIYKEEVLPNSMLRDIMIANPQSAKNQELIESLDNRNNLPDYMKAQILQGKSLIGAMEDLLAQKAFYNQSYASAYKYCMNYYLQDTLTPQASYDSLVVLLANEPQINARYQLAAMQLQSGHFTQVNATINNIGTAFSLNTQEQIEYAQMQDYFSFLINMQENNISLEDLNDQQLALLEDLEYSASGSAKDFARNIRLILGLSDYTEPYLLPNFNKSSELQWEEQKLRKSLEDFHYLKVYPNPAKDYIIVEYTLDSDIGQSLLQLTDISGKIIYSQDIVGLKDQKHIDIRHIQAGNYMLSLLVNKTVLETVKVSIVK